MSKGPAGASLEKFNKTARMRQICDRLTRRLKGVEDSRLIVFAIGDEVARLDDEIAELRDTVKILADSAGITP